uniref:Uncharacterized protein n=1 Tax=Syphacia muris TaxID=451379 RepID=A0A0N5AAB4_9BILA
MWSRAGRAENRKVLEELNRTRQLMMKSSGLGTRAIELPAIRNPRKVQLMNMETHTTITFIPSNSQYSNSLLPVFPRFPS